MRGKKLLAVFLLTVSFCFLPALSMARKPGWNGYLWNQLSLQAKQSYTAGYVDGMGKILGSVFISGTLRIGEERFESKDVFALAKAIYEYHIKDYPGSFPVVQVVEGIDNFYNDSGNRTILIADAVRVVCMRLRSEPEEKINRMIEILRREAQGREKEGYHEDSCVNIR